MFLLSLLVNEFQSREAHTRYSKYNDLFYTSFTQYNADIGKHSLSLSKASTRHLFRTVMFPLHLLSVQLSIVRNCLANEKQKI